jgi:hypothetical protein
VTTPTALSLLLNGVGLADRIAALGYPPTASVRAKVAAEMNVVNGLILAHARGEAVPVATIKAHQARLVELVGEWTAAGKGGRS